MIPELVEGAQKCLRQIRDRLRQRGAASSSVRFELSNLTRRTVLASRLEVADHGAKRSKGLLGREGLATGGGMWIVPCEAVHTFGMRFPIDLVYIDRKNMVRKVCSSVVPWRMSACFAGHSVVELPSGTVAETLTQPGDLLQFSPAAQAE